MAIAPKSNAAPAVQTQPAKAPEQQQKKKSIFELLVDMKGQLAAAVPKHLNPERMGRLAMTALRESPRLAQCTQESLLGAIMTAAQLGLEPNTKKGECYLIPYNRKKKLQDGTWTEFLECQFQLGYKGLIQLCENSKIYRRFAMDFVLVTDTFEYSMGFSATLKHSRAKRADGRGYIDTGETHSYYALYETVNGGENFKVWSKERVTAHAKRFSKAYDKKDSPWQEHFDMMAQKTVMIDLLKTAPKSADVANAIANDNAVVKATIEEDKIISITPTFEHLEEPDTPELNAAGQTETMAAVAKEELDAKEKVRQDILAKVEERLSERIKAGMDVVEFENKIGMSLDSINGLDSNKLMTVIEVLEK